MNFKDQNIIITGGTRGIGAGIARAFLAEGARVILSFSSDDASAKQFREENIQYSDFIDLHKFDVSNYSKVERFYAEIDEKYKSIDVLVNNAGIRQDKIVGMMSEEEWDRVLNINLKGCFLMCKFAVQRMSRQRHGKIINITSPSGRMGFPGQGNYAASKAGMVAFSRSLSQEVASRKINVNCVSPGFITTDLIADLKDEMLEKYKNQIPFKRFGCAEDVAQSVLFLASDKASYITGSVLEVTGGL